MCSMVSTYCYCRYMSMVRGGVLHIFYACECSVASFACMQTATMVQSTVIGCVAAKAPLGLEANLLCASQQCPPNTICSACSQMGSGYMFQRNCVEFMQISDAHISLTHFLGRIFLEEILICHLGALFIDDCRDAVIGSDIGCFNGSDRFLLRGRRCRR